MLVQDYIRINKHNPIKYSIDGVIYNSENDIPEDIKNTKVMSYIYHMTTEMILMMRTEKTHKEEDCFE